MRRFANDIILEGGAIEINGPGQLLTTEAVLLNAEPQPGHHQGRLHAPARRGPGRRRKSSGCADGLPNDDTDGHIDNITRFFRDDGIVTVTPPLGDARTPRRTILRHNRLALDEDFRTPAGSGLKSPSCRCPLRRWTVDGRELPASYANYVVTNGAVLMPAYNRPTDAIAAHVLHECFPSRKIVPLDCTRCPARRRRAALPDPAAAGVKCPGRRWFFSFHRRRERAER